MKISRLQYNEKFQALEIYLSGCDGACDWCHNPALFDFDVGYDAFGSIYESILDKANTPIVQNIWVLGGEPLLQNSQELQYFLASLKGFLRKPIMLWTRFYEIPENIRQYIDYAKVGEYQKDSIPYVEHMFGVTLASENQKIIKMTLDK